MSAATHSYPSSRHSDDCWETAEAAAEQLHREVAEARAEIQRGDAEAKWRGKHSRHLRWTDDMIATLRTMRAEGEALYWCAIRIGVAYPTCVYKARELGLADRMNRGARPATKVLQEARA
jgi:hypothetical protein